MSGGGHYAPTPLVGVRVLELAWPTLKCVRTVSVPFLKPSNYASEISNPVLLSFEISDPILL